MKERRLGKEAAELADYWFYETAVKLHREGEGAPYAGLKPAGLDWVPVVPRAKKAIEKGDPGEVIEYLLHAIKEELMTRFKHVLETNKHDVDNVDAARDCVKAELWFVLFSHGLYAYITGAGEHGDEEGRGHRH